MALLQHFRSSIVSCVNSRPIARPAQIGWAYHFMGAIEPVAPVTGEHKRGLEGQRPIKKLKSCGGTHPPTPPFSANGFTALSITNLQLIGNTCKWGTGVETPAEESKGAFQIGTGLWPLEAEFTGYRGSRCSRLDRAGLNLRDDSWRWPSPCGLVPDAGRWPLRAERRRRLGASVRGGFH